jgi:VIT1/CCC1 family predicted Fe2+/Mn2+ transporter
MQAKSSFLKKFVETIVSKRMRRGVLSSEFLERELSEPVSAFVVSALETIILFVFLTYLTMSYSISFSFVFIFFGGYLIWKTGFTAYQSWKKLIKLNQIIQDEKYEIEHHRENEKKELETLYSSKGFSGKLLNDVTTVLMADDNRLLEVMLEEEMGLALESFEHPLKIALGTFLGILSSFCLLGLCYFFMGMFGLIAMSGVFLTFIAVIVSHYEKLSLLKTLIWFLAIAFVSFFTCTLLRSLL